MRQQPSSKLQTLLHELNGLGSTAERQRYLLQRQHDLTLELLPYLANTQRISTVVVRNLFAQLGVKLDKNLSGIISEAFINQRRTRT